MRRLTAGMGVRTGINECALSAFNVTRGRLKFTAETQRKQRNKLLPIHPLRHAQGGTLIQQADKLRTGINECALSAFNVTRGRLKFTAETQKQRNKLLPIHPLRHAQGGALIQQADKLRTGINDGALSALNASGDG